MSILVAMLTLMLLAAVMAVVSRPLLTTHRPEESDTPKHSELEAEREAKYREIRDAELDYRTGKLSEDDYAAVNSTLRAEAVEILNKLDSSEEDWESRATGVDRVDQVDQAAEEDQAAGPAK
jgi:type II secretory pathway component PulM